MNPRHRGPTPSAQIWAAEAVTEPIPVVEPERRPWRYDGTGRHRAAAAPVGKLTTTGRHRVATPTTGAVSVARVAAWAAAFGLLGFGGYAYTADRVLSPGDYPSVSDAAPVTAAPSVPDPIPVTADPPDAGHRGGHRVPDPVPSTTDYERGGSVDCGN